MRTIGAVLFLALSATSLAQAESPAFGAGHGSDSILPSEPVPAFADAPADAYMSSNPAGAAPAAFGGQAEPAAHAGEPGPIASTALGAMYYQSNLSGLYAAHFAQYALGWYGIEQVNVTKSLGVMAEFDNTYDLHGVNGASSHAMMAGPVYTVRTKWIRPYVFAVGGAVRTSYQGALIETSTGPYRETGFVEWDAAAAGGVGANFRLTHSLAFQVIPGEYVATKATTGDWASNYQAKVGLVFNMYGKRAQ